MMSQFKAIRYPKVHRRKDGRYEIVVYFSGRRYRIQNGKKFGVDLSPNLFPPVERLNQSNRLAAEIYSRLISGICPTVEDVKSQRFDSDLEFVEHALKIKLDQNISFHYRKQLKYTFDKLKHFCPKGNIEFDNLHRLFNSFPSKVSYNTTRRVLLVLFNQANSLGWVKKPLKEFTAIRSCSKLHSPIRDLESVLEDIRRFNSKLHLCCLLTYGCLLRPHREIRELKWSDFTDDLCFIKLSGERNKSGRNRVVPIPKYIRNFLNKTDNSLNIFSGEIEPYNRDYFKKLWRKYSLKSKLLDEGNTLYSFRHTAAINLYEATGSLEKIRIAMDHSNITTSLIYLRGLEISDLKEEDMPIINSIKIP